jgi:hypothetical protein
MKLPVASDKDLLDILRISVQPRFTPDELYEVSLTREPRSAKAEELNSPPKSPLFRDWTAGIDTNVDEATVKKYIAAMVEVSFTGVYLLVCVCVLNLLYCTTLNFC